MHLVASALTLVLQASPAPAPAQPAAAAPPVAAQPAAQPVAQPDAPPVEPPVAAPPVAPAPTPAPVTYASASDAEAAPRATTQPAAPAPEPEPTVPASTLHRKLVFANLYGVNFSVLSAIPSAEVSFFLGTNLRPRRAAGRFDWNTALGYQLTVAVGRADRASLDAAGVVDPALNGLFVHRHHLTAVGYGGKNQHLFYAYGGGAWFNFTSLAGVEAEGRLGYLFGQPPQPDKRRPRGVVGGHARLSGAFEGPPLLHVGVFGGILLF